ncbi:MAG TPA: UDP-N-acetylmuramoyl-L-alanyl-D-glutamate--2,6-diaminopimelate ligase, partial [Bacteroidia bacterium]|nr:UDP-N-acetylmuramoyl-L-alanyl-D-glutamate--2,6-diaminopimelate ligase [Bacteroidia bacterium]
FGRIPIIAITGTNGKTTTATLLYQLFKDLGYKTGLLSTVKNKINDTEIEATHTTPDALTLHKLLQQMVEAGCTHAFMEVSSHAVVQQRIAGVQFAGAVFTNITHDHLDYHKTFDAYIAAKKGFFDGLPDTAFALTNDDDKNGKVMLQNTKAKKYTYALRTHADFKCKVLENNFGGLMLQVNKHEVLCKLVGTFNAYNIVSVYGTAVLLGEEPISVLKVLSNLQPPAGRFEYVVSNQITGIVDYAHTPDAVKNVLATIGDIRTGNEKVITVIGCGGDRDKTKRPEMAKLASMLSNKVIITSDNPRSENPLTIIAEMQAGVPASKYKNVLAIADRKEAIRTACNLAAKGDIILVAGKGHEKYQEIQGVKYPFDDLEILTQTLNQNQIQ